jgi:hypothetical protein
VPAVIAPPTYTDIMDARLDRPKRRRGAFLFTQGRAQALTVSHVNGMQVCVGLRVELVVRTVT